MPLTTTIGAALTRLTGGCGTMDASGPTNPERISSWVPPRARTWANAEPGTTAGLGEGSDVNATLTQSVYISPIGDYRENLP